MAAELQEGLGVEVEMVEGAGGVFDVTVDGKVVYSKHRTARFPNPGEVLEAVQNL